MFTVLHPLVMRGYPRQLPLDVFGDRLIGNLKRNFVPRDTSTQRCLQIVWIDFDNGFRVVDIGECYEIWKIIGGDLVRTARR